MPFPLIPLAISGIGALAGALSNKKGARTGTQNNTSTTTFTEPPAYASMGDLLRKRITDRLNSTYDLSGYEANGLTGINDAFSGAQTNLNADLTARGLSTSPVAATAKTNLGTERAGSIAQFLSSLPMLRRQMEGEDLTRATGFYAGRPLSTTNTQSGTQLLPGSPLGAGIGSAAELLAFFAGQGLLGGGGTK